MIRNIVLFLLFFTISFSSIWAEQAPNDLKDLAVRQIFLYARELYDRGDYREAEHAFTHLLQLNPNDAPALEYMQALRKKAEENRAWSTSFNAAPMSSLPAPSMSVDASASAGSSNSDLKAEITAEDQDLNKLNEDIKQLRPGSMETVSHEPAEPQHEE